MFRSLAAGASAVVLLVSAGATADTASLMIGEWSVDPALCDGDTFVFNEDGTAVNLDNEPADFAVSEDSLLTITPTDEDSEDVQITRIGIESVVLEQADGFGMLTLYRCDELNGAWVAIEDGGCANPGAEAVTIENGDTLIPRLGDNAYPVPFTIDGADLVIGEDAVIEVLTLTATTLTVLQDAEETVLERCE